MDFNQMLRDAGPSKGAGDASAQGDAGVSSTLASFHYGLSGRADADAARKQKREQQRRQRDAKRKSSGAKNAAADNSDANVDSEDDAVAPEGGAAVAKNPQDAKARERHVKGAQSAARVAFRSLSAVMRSHFIATGRSERARGVDVLAGASGGAGVASTEAPEVLDVSRAAVVQIASALPPLLRARRQRLADARRSHFTHRRVFIINGAAELDAEAKWSALSRTAAGSGCRVTVTSEARPASVAAAALDCYSMSRRGLVAPHVIASSGAAALCTVFAVHGNADVEAAQQPKQQQPEEIGTVDVFDGDGGADEAVKRAAALLATSSDDED